MAVITIPNSPVHSDTVLTAVYGETGPSWARFHTGTDFAPTGSTPSNPDLYSVCEGVVERVFYDNVLGNIILIRDNSTGNYWRYCHMKNASTLRIGDRVNTGNKVRCNGRNRNRSTWGSLTP